LSFRFSAIKTESLIFWQCLPRAVRCDFTALILAKIFKSTRITALITSTAGIYGPAFIAPAADALKNAKWFCGAHLRHFRYA
jgi:hypothetical protein